MFYKMKYNPDKHHRRSIRLKEYDYSQAGWYFVTVCTHEKICQFGNIINMKMIFNDGGKIAETCWLDIPKHYPNVELDEFVIMPNHVHGIIVINDKNVGVQNFESQQNVESQYNKFQNIIPRSLGSIVRGFKIGVTKWFRQNTDVYTVWQRNYYEHIIRNDNELYRIRKYILKNPFKWNDDKYFSP